MSETYIAIDELLDRINTHPDVNSTARAQVMLDALGCKQDTTKKPRTHIITSKKRNYGLTNNTNVKNS